MARINDGTFRNWNNGDVMNEADYEQEREIIRTAINDNYDRLIKKFEVLDSAGTLKATQNLTTALNYLKFKESDTVLLTLDNVTGTLTLAVKDASTTTAKIVDGAVTTVKLSDGSVTTAKIANGAVTLDKVSTASLDTRYTTKTGDHDGTWKGYTHPMEVPTTSMLYADLEIAKRAPIEYTWTATANQTSFVLPNGNTFPVGEKAIDLVTVDGVPQTTSVTEKTDGTGFDLSEGVPAGTKVFIRYFKFHAAWTAGHSSTHHIGGTDVLDVTQLTNYQTQIADKISILTNSKVEVFNVVEKYGHLKVAVTGGYDWKPAINQAITDASLVKGTVFFNSQEFLVTGNIIIKSNVNLLGCGIDKTIIKMVNYTGGGQVLQNQDASNPVSNIKIENMTVNANNQSTEFGVIGFQGGTTFCENITLINVKAINGKSTNITGGIGVGFGNCKNVRLLFVESYDNQNNGFDFNNSQNIIAIGCKSDRNYDGFFCGHNSKDIMYIGCTTDSVTNIGFNFYDAPDTTQTTERVTVMNGVVKLAGKKALYINGANNVDVLGGSYETASTLYEHAVFIQNQNTTEVMYNIKIKSARIKGSTEFAIYAEGNVDGLTFDDVDVRNNKFGVNVNDSRLKNVRVTNSDVRSDQDYLSKGSIIYQDHTDKSQLFIKDNKELSGYRTLVDSDYNVATSATLLNGFANYGSGYTNAQFYRDHSRIIHIEGTLLAGSTVSAGTVLFTLPVGYRPTTNKVYACTSDQGFTKIDVSSNGNVSLASATVTATTGNVTLDGITFKTT